MSIDMFNFWSPEAGSCYAQTRRELNILIVCLGTASSQLQSNGHDQAGYGLHGLIWYGKSCVPDI